ncbi:MAG: FKBP-type peptidyl-prolyl cis-trans isomerase [Clostridia bacterium]|nr:FKBP-type peptidyl-prolyl cis-trans isomerase [Clostridia bacterium]
MKKLISVLLLVSLIGAMLCGCGKNREMYTEDLAKYVKAGEYLGIEIDTKSKEYTEIHKDFYDADMADNLVEVKEGTAANGDLVVIDYVGKKDGVAFDGGTASGYELELGSNSFIDGFESGIVGHAFGTKFNLNLKFPESYLNEDLAGKAVVFEVTLHSKKVAPELDTALAQKMGFADVADYEADLKDRALKQFCFVKVAGNFSVTDYPEDEIEIYYNSIKKYYTELASAYSMTFEQFLTANNMTEETFETQLKEYSIKPSMKNEMYLYYIFDKEKLELPKEEIEKQIAAAAEAEGKTVAEIKKSGETYAFEVMAVKEITLSYLVSKAVIK